MTFSVKPFQNGELAYSNFGIGVRLGYVYTQSGIVQEGLEIKKSIQRTEAHPQVAHGLSQFAWCRWDRLSPKSAFEMVSRCRCASETSTNIDDLMDYAGTGFTYLQGWRKYITVEDRLRSLSKVFRLKTVEGKRVLDLGCAGGRHLLQLASYGADTYGIECNPAYFGNLHPMLSNRVFYGDALMDTYWFASDSFDIVICSAHGTVNFPELGHIFSEVSRILTIGGILLLDVPSKPINIGPRLVQDHRVYLKTLKRCGLHPKSWSTNQIVCTAVRKSTNMESV